MEVVKRDRLVFRVKIWEKSSCHEKLDLYEFLLLFLLAH